MLPLLVIYVCLIEDAAKSTNRDFAMFGNYGRVDGFRSSADELDVAAFLAMLGESNRFQPTLDFAEG